MTIEPTEPDRGIPAPVGWSTVKDRFEAEPGEPEKKALDTSFEVDLDELAGADSSPRVLHPVPVDQPEEKPGDRRPIIPAYLTSVEGIKNTARREFERATYNAGYYAIRSPWVLLVTLFWAIVGLLKLAGAQLRWWWQPDAVRLEQEAANEGVNMAPVWSKVRKEAGAKRLFRFWVLFAELLSLLAVSGVLARAGVLVQLAALALLAPLLTYYARRGKGPLIRGATVKPKFRKLRSDIVLRAYYAAGLGHPEKEGQQVEFDGVMSRDKFNVGSQVDVSLPFGKTFEDAMERRGRIASGLDVTLAQVQLKRSPKSQRSHRLWVADEDPLAISPGKTPLLKLNLTDVWQPAPLGLDLQSQKVSVPLMWQSILVGAMPRQGKTFTARQLAGFVALDPYVRLSVFDFKGSPDWTEFAKVAWSFGFGLLPDENGDPIENLKKTLYQAQHEVQVRNRKLRELPPEICPEGKLTREIARDLRYKMPVWVIVLDEFQDGFDSGDEENDEEISALLCDLIRKGPSVGIIFIDATQRPVDIGSNRKVKSRFNTFRNLHQTRFALRTGSWQDSERILGDGTFSQGLDASTLPVGDGTDGGPDYRGNGILHGTAMPSGVVRTYRCDGIDTKKIIAAAVAHRRAAGTLDGMAAGSDTVDGVVVDPVTDALSVILPDETGVQWEELAERLADAMPSRYTKIDGRATSARLTRLGVASKNVRKPGAVGKDAVRKGVARKDLLDVLANRDSRD